MTDAATYRPASRILDFAQRHPNHTALIIDGETWSYRELVLAAQEIASHLPSAAAGAPQPITAVMAQRHISSYAGILAARLSGHAYVPLNVNHPGNRNAMILQSSGAHFVICGAHAAGKLKWILAATDLPTGTHTRIDCGDRKSDYQLQAVDDLTWLAGERRGSVSDLAYILFTSGSTGNPKGVPIQNAQLEAYLKAVQPLLGVRQNDRFSQTFDLTFDLSVHDLFVCWENGATLVVPSEKELRMPSDYIRRNKITCWFSVPSLAYQIRLQEDLTPDAFPDLRVSLFCGEALPTAVAAEWVLAAPNSQVENWYGPTEATIACSRYVVRGAPTDDDTVPIGKAFENMELLVLDENLAPIPAGVAGELFLSGAQVATGYLNDPEKTQASFVPLPGSGKIVYRTGDRAIVSDDGNVKFLGRVDNQVKVRGYRIELGEVEAAIRTASSGLNTVALAWPGGTEIATSIVAALEVGSADIAAIHKTISTALPDYMVPSMIFCVAEFPKNTSGKIDRKALAELLVHKAHDDSANDTPLPTPEAELLLKAILTHAPLLSRKNILESSNLFDAGMDSLAFISVTTELEHHFGLSLDQDTVILLSEMSFDEIVSEVRGETSLLAPGEGAEEKSSVMNWLRSILRRPRIIRKPRANRALQFIERFPGYLTEHGAPDVLMVGSSGVFRAFSPADFTQAAAEYGENLSALNVGLPAVNSSGIHMICEFIRDQCKASHARVPLIIYEFDPMLVSTTPPSGDMNLGPDFFSGNVLSLRAGDTNPEFQWLVETSGAWNAPEKAQQKTRKPNWARDRDRVIARAYLGDIEFDPQRVDDWLAGARALQKVADRVILFLHPADREMTDELKELCESDALKTFSQEVSDKLGVSTLPWEDFDLQPADFLDVNHMNAHTGRGNLSRQLARMIYASKT